MEQQTDASLPILLWALIPLLVGWLLGLASSILLESYRRWREKKDIESGLRAELSEARNRFAAVAYRLAGRVGRYNIEFFQWMHACVVNYDGPLFTSETRSAMEKLSQLSEQELKTALLAHNAPEDRRMLAAKKSALPFLDSKLDSISTFQPSTQQKILNIRAQVDIFNEQVEELKEWGRLSFDSNLTEEDRDAVHANLDQAHVAVFERARMIADFIASLEPELA